MPSIWFPKLDIKIFNLDEVAFKIFGATVYWYALIILTGLIIGLLAVIYNCKKENEDYEVYMDFLFYGYITAIVSARIYYVMFEWDTYKNDLISILKINEGGIAIYGAVIGGVVCAFVYTKVKKLNFLNFADFAIVGLPIGQAIGRWGNFVNREAYGGYTDSFFKMRILKEEATKLTADITNNLVVVDGFEYIQVHPTFLYESIWNLLNFIILMTYFKNRKFKGEIFFMYFIIYGIGRYFIEGLRVDQLIIGDTGVAVSQLLSIVMVLVSTGLLIYSRKKIKKS